MTKLEFTRQIESNIHTASYESLQGSLGGREIPVNYEWSPETARKQRAPVVSANTVDPLFFLFETIKYITYMVISKQFAESDV